MTILKRDSANWEIRVVVKVSLVGFPYYRHSCRKPSRVCAVVDFFFFLHLQNFIKYVRNSGSAFSETHFDLEMAQYPM